LLNINLEGGKTTNVNHLGGHNMVDNYGLRVDSEIGKLKKVILHRPGKELDNLVPRFLEDLLFDEIPWLERARDEHDGFREALIESGAEVYYIDDLVKEIIRDITVKQELITEHLNFTRLPNYETAQKVSDYLMGLDDDALICILNMGLRKEQISKLKQHQSLSDLTVSSYPFYLDPMPSMYFTRDHGAMIKDRLLVSQMFNFSRRRETISLRLVQKYHALFANTPLIHEGELPTGIEGGDVLVLKDDTVLIGYSQRTTEAAIETVAQTLLEELEFVRQILVVQIPAKRAYMHLDTVFTMVDHDKFLLYPGISRDIHCFKLTRSQDGGVEARTVDSLERLLGEALGKENIKIIYSGGTDPITAAREQWGDSTNTLAVAPGKVITYNRNAVTNRILENNGIEVIQIEGGELVRGRGGPRCMSMPISRERI